MYPFRDAGTTGAAGASAPLAFAFSTLWVQCGCRLWVQQVHKTFTTDRIKRRSRMDVCGGVPPPIRQEFGKVVMHLAKGKTGKHYLWNFWREITEELRLNNWTVFEI